MDLLIKSLKINKKMKVKIIHFHFLFIKILKVYKIIFGKFIEFFVIVYEKSREE